MEPTIFDHILITDVQAMAPGAQNTLMHRWTALRRGRDPYRSSEDMAEAMIRRAYPTYYAGPVIMCPGVTQEEEIAERCQRATLSYAYREPDGLLPVREKEAGRRIGRVYVVVQAFIILLAIWAGVIVFGVLHGLSLPSILGGR